MLRKIVKALIPRQLFRKVEPYGHWAEAVLANVYYGFPYRGLKVIGVTGTDGKTTTSTLIFTLLKESGLKVGLITTAAYGAGDDIKPNMVHMTTAGPFALLSRVKELRAKGIEWLVLETTSHALAQHRVWGAPYSVAVMTNVTHEHLDYHGTFENYRDAKIELFKLADANTAGLRTGIINSEDGSADRFASAISRPLTYGIGKGQLSAEDVKSTPTGSDFVARYGDRELKLRVNLPGTFNVSNALAAAGVGLAVGLSDRQIEQGIAALEGVEGRMDRVEAGQDFAVIVDFAHTPDSFNRMLASMKELTDGRLIVVFGSAGRRDKTKRALQGEAAGKHADIVIVTEEDDRDEDGLQIMHEIADGVKKHGKVFNKDLFEIHDRTQAIEYAIDLAKPGDTVMLLGKGHEKTIERNDGEHPWNEAETARSAIKKLKKD